MDRVNNIKQQIEAALEAVLPQLKNPSKTAEYKQWVNIFANIQANVEAIIAQDKAHISSVVDSNHIGTAAWYVTLAKQYQDGPHKLTIEPDTGIIRYEVIDPAARIVTQAGCIVSDSSVIVRVATGEPGSLQPITPTQAVKLNEYLLDLKIAGVKVKAISNSPDILELRANVYYDPAYSISELKEAVTAALDRYSMELPFNGVILRNSVIDAIQSVPGIADVELADVVDNENPSNNISALVAIHGDIRKDVGRSYPTYSGYFNFKKENDFPVLNFIENDD